ncbi:branched-chain amino acid ABC transporter substrate-binding protein [Rhizobium sp. AAP43]|uniref:branched-chain amino acid ABC transporter substrate-binding protein n=1 Tax=Rhizobium sp. AAP43 TaxID=1523420 RepID=UPI0006B9DAE6|nr:branched-chain amino acid ABC transporter substrate-binding protein [Rhizobium sp. AAP43]KPF44199.1 amino acid ABC transporter [Rhizobium sp. AAP43]
MKRLTLTLLLLGSCLVPASAQQLTLAIVAPKSGNFESLGNQVRQGAQLAAGSLSISLIEIHEPCTEGSGPVLAEQIAKSGAKAAIGFLCSESLVGGLPVLAEAKIPAITLSVRWKGMMEDALKNGWPFFRLGPHSDSEAQKLTEIILRDWKGEAIALVEDGTIRGRELTEAIRIALEERGLKPVFVDTFRPGQENQLALIRRLRNAGATRVFAGADRNDVAIMARDAAAEVAPMKFLGGDAIRAPNEPVALQEGVLAVGLAEKPAGPSAAAITEALAAGRIPAEGYVVPAHAAVTLLADALGISSAMGTPLAETLVGTDFKTALGPIRFGDDHELAVNPYQLMEWRGGDFVPIAAASQ